MLISYIIAILTVNVMAFEPKQGANADDEEDADADDDEDEKQACLQYWQVVESDVLEETLEKIFGFYQFLQQQQRQPQSQKAGDTGEGEEGEGEENVQENIELLLERLSNLDALLRLRRKRHLYNIVEKDCVQEAEEIPSEFVCPMTGKLMIEPMLLTDGLCYEREAIERWFVEGHRTSPVTKEELIPVAEGVDLMPNDSLQQAIQSFVGMRLQAIQEKEEKERLMKKKKKQSQQKLVKQQKGSQSQARKRGGAR
jgi:hypothetical protein